MIVTVWILTGALLLAVGFWMGTRSSISTSRMTLEAKNQAESHLRTVAETMTREREMAREIETSSRRTTARLAKMREEILRETAATKLRVDLLKTDFDKLDTSIGTLMAVLQKSGILTPTPTRQKGATRPEPEAEDHVPAVRRSVPQSLGTPT